MTNLKETVWYDCRSVANILKLALLVKERWVYFDSAVENAFLVFKKDGTMTNFIEEGLGIYVHGNKHNNDVPRNTPNTYDNK